MPEKKGVTRKGEPMSKCTKLITALALAVIFCCAGTDLYAAGSKTTVKSNAQSNSPTPSTDNKNSDFESSRGWAKLGSSLQEAWLDAKRSGDMSRRFDCFVRVRAPADSGDESFLLDNGFVVRLFSGTIASGHLKAQDLPHVANLYFVDSIKLAKLQPPTSP